MYLKMHYKCLLTLTVPFYIMVNVNQLPVILNFITINELINRQNRQLKHKQNK